MYRIFVLTLCAAIAAQGLRLAAQAPVHVSPTAPQATVVVDSQKPGTRLVIRGNALTATNSPLSEAVVRLRDARYGRVLDTQTTDAAGVFEFKPVDPGTYVVELLGNDQRVAAASQLLNGDAGDVLTTIVKLPWHGAGGLLGHGLASLVAISSAAVASGVLARTVTGTPASGEK